MAITSESSFHINYQESSKVSSPACDVAGFEILLVDNGSNFLDRVPVKAIHSSPAELFCDRGHVGDFDHAL